MTAAESSAALAYTRARSSMPSRVLHPWIAGRERDGGSLVEIASPFDARVVGSHTQPSERDLEDALAAAHAARRVASSTSTALRAAVLERLAVRLRAKGHEVAHTLASEAGKPISFARAEVARAALTLELCAANARTFSVGTPPIDVDPRGAGRVALTQRVPRGPLAAITPFNFPLNLVVHKLAPAIAVGAPFVLKPSPQCPLTALEFARWIVEADWPAEAVNVVPCGPPLAQRLVTDPRIAVLSFTGSDSVGWKLAALAGRKHTVLELGGAAPCIIDDRVDFEPLLEPLALSAFGYAGQVCIKTQRILVPRARLEEFAARFARVANSLPLGDPLDEGTLVGPLIDEASAQRVVRWIDEARAAGARLLCGGERSGSIVAPAVILDAPRSARVVCDEVFGPVVVVEPFDSFEDALVRANDSRFGLQAGVYTRELAHALRAQRELEYGAVIVNDTPTLRFDALAYGGVKDSGAGREGPLWAMEEYTQPRVLVLRGLD